MECISDDNEVWPDLLYVHVEDVEGPYDPNDVDPATRKACEAWLSRDFEQEQREEQEFYRMIDGRNREAVQWELDQKRLYTRVLTPPPSPPHQPHPPNGEKKPEVTTQSRHIQPPSNRIHKPSKKPANIVELRKARRKAQREVIRRPATRSMRAELVALDPDQRNRVTVFGMESDVSMEFSEYAIVQTMHRVRQQSLHRMRARHHAKIPHREPDDEDVSSLSLPSGITQSPSTSDSYEGRPIRDIYGLNTAQDALQS